MAITWNEKNCFTEGQLQEMASTGEIQSLTIQETMLGYIVVADAKLAVYNDEKNRWERKWLPAAWRTRREAEPRVFSTLDRLMDKLSENFPGIGTVRVEMLSPEERQEKQKLLASRIPVGKDGKKESGRPKAIKGLDEATVKKTAAKAKKAG